MNAQMVISHQLQGVMLHHDLMLAFAILGKHYKCKEQRRHMYHEMQNMDKTNFAVIKETGAIVDPGPLAKVKIPDVKASMTDAEKVAACKALLDAWHTWEKETTVFYQAQLATDPQNKWLKHLMDEAYDEMTHIERHYKSMI